MNNDGPNSDITKEDLEIPNSAQGYDLKTLDMVAKSQPIIFESLPKAVRADLDSMASSIFDPHGGRTLVIGFPMAGKSFFIEQFANNIDRYLEKTNQDELLFIVLSAQDISVIESLPGRYSTYIESILHATKLKPEEICFVTESFEIATALSIYADKCKIIFELSVFTYNQLIQLELNGQSKTWMSWPAVDVNFTHCSKSELTNLLYDSLSEQLLKAFKVEIKKKDILVFINYALKTIPALMSSNDKDKIVVPPGVWANAIRRLAGALAFTSELSMQDKKGKTVFAKVVIKTFEEIRDNFDEYLSLDNDDDSGTLDGLPTELLDAMGIKLVKAPRAAGQDIEKKENPKSTLGPLLFSDFDTLSERLMKEVIGQDAAVETAVEGLIVPAAGLNDTTKPIRSMLFLGPTGVGKTKLALTLAEKLMKEPLHVVRLDMSEYSQANEAVKLFGAPPGYVGHGQGGALTSAVQAHPHSLILLDEVEKAHPLIWDSFLQVLDAGRMTTGTGVEVDFTKTVIVMTSNLGSKELAKKSSGFSIASSSIQVDNTEKNKKVILEKVEEFFKPELINRIDELVIFQELSEDTTRKILVKEIETVFHRAALAGFTLKSPSADIIEVLLNKSNVSKYGAREIQRVVLKNVSGPIARSMLKKELGSMNLSLTINDKNEISVLEK